MNMAGTWFGPVSLFTPIKQVSQIMSGMIMFSYILKTEKKLSKDVSCCCCCCQVSLSSVACRVLNLIHA